MNNSTKENKTSFDDENEQHSDGNYVPDIAVPPATAGVLAKKTQPAVEESATSTDARSFWPSWKKFKTQFGAEENPAKPVALAPTQMNDFLYNMGHPSRGKCLIFNHSSFHENQRISDRAGTDVDVKRITTTFEELEFTVIVYNNFRFENIEKTLKTFASENHSYEDCVVIFILTHGQSGHLYAYDVTYKLTTLCSFFAADRCPTLAGKPKMIFIQACRGDLYDSGITLKSSRTQVDGPSNQDQTFRIPNLADFLTVHSTCEGFYSFRNTKNGSPFIKALCEVFNLNSRFKDALSMMTMVNREVAIEFESRAKDPSQNMKKQVPQVCHTLTREIFFTKKPKCSSA